MSVRPPNIVAAAVLCALAAAVCTTQADPPRVANEVVEIAPLTAKAGGPMLAHMVFFTLKESTPTTQQALVAACDKYLAGHDGVAYYSAGVRAAELDRGVNDTTFDVGLHVVFKDKAAHDAYQVAPRHLKFIEENKETWGGVRVFDSYIK